LDRMIEGRGVSRCKQPGSVPPLMTEYCKWRDYPTYDGKDTNRVKGYSKSWEPSRAVARKVNDQGAV
jgi:hypothetical protein